MSEPDPNTGRYRDFAGRPVNQKGYLVNFTGDIINNVNGEKMFGK